MLLPLADTPASHQSIGDGRNPSLSPNLQISRMSTKKGSQYVYYRLYNKGGRIKSQHPIYANDSFIGRTLARLVTPPHMAATLKRHLCSIEGFTSPDMAKLFVPLSCPTAKDDSARLSLPALSGPGLLPQEPMALFLGGQERAGASHQLAERDLEISDLGEIRYIYYRPCSLEGAIKSKTCFDEDDVYLGRLDMLSVPPPHIIASLATSIAKVEGLVVQDTLITEQIRILKEIGSEVVMGSEAALSLTEDTYLGNDEDDPVAVIWKPCRASNPDIMAVSGHNIKKSYRLPIDGIVKLESQFKADGAITFQSVGLNMDSCVSRGIQGVWLNILSASNDIIFHMSIRRGTDCIALFDFLAKEQRWGCHEMVPLKGLFKGPNPTIIIYDHGDRYQVIIENVTVTYFVKGIIAVSNKLENVARKTQIRSPPSQILLQ